jgi:hypothetical protein
MKTGGFRFAGNEQPVSLARHTQFEEQDAIAGLVDLLDAGVA